MAPEVGQRPRRVARFRFGCGRVDTCGVAVLMSAGSGEVTPRTRHTIAHARDTCQVAGRQITTPAVRIRRKEPNDSNDSSHHERSERPERLIVRVHVAHRSVRAGAEARAPGSFPVAVVPRSSRAPVEPPRSVSGGSPPGNNRNTTSEGDPPEGRRHPLCTSLQRRDTRRTAEVAGLSADARPRPALPLFPRGRHDGAAVH